MSAKRRKPCTSDSSDDAAEANQERNDECDFLQNIEGNCDKVTYCEKEEEREVHVESDLVDEGEGVKGSTDDRTENNDIEEPLQTSGNVWDIVDREAALYVGSDSNTSDDEEDIFLDGLRA